MTQVVAGTATPEEAVAPVAADLGDLSTEQVAEENNVVVEEEVSTDELSDEDFSKFMDSQLGNPDFEEVANIDPATTDELPAVEEELVDDSVDPLVADDSTGPSYTIKVDGQDITVTDPADINRLLERGLNSAAEAKANLPAQKLAQMLANNKLTDTATLSRLIDISKGDRGALIALLKEQDIDPYSLVNSAGDEEAAYKPTDHSVSDGQIELNQVLDSLQDSEAFATTADVVMEKWDTKSRQTFMDNPKNFTILNNQVADGTYKAISDEMKKLDMLGKLPQGDTQFDVYKLVGDQMFSESMLPGQTAPAASEKIAQQPVTEPAQPTAEQRLQQAAKLQQRKRAVAPSRSVPQKQTNHQIASEQFVNSSSDEEFIAQTSHLFNSM